MTTLSTGSSASRNHVCLFQLIGDNRTLDVKYWEYVRYFELGKSAGGQPIVGVEISDHAHSGLETEDVYVAMMGNVRGNEVRPCYVRILYQRSNLGSGSQSRDSDPLHPSSDRKLGRPWNKEPCHEHEHSDCAVRQP